jgi:TonB family protein
MKIISQQLLTLLFNSLWQIALIAAVATLCARLLRAAKASTRHLLWVAALVAPVCLAAVTLWIGLNYDFFTRKPAAAQIDFTPTVLMPNYPMVTASQAPTPEKAIPVGRNLAIALMVGYLLLLVFLSIQLLRAWLKTRTIVRGAKEMELPAHIQTIVEHCLEIIGITKVRVLWSPTVSVPVTIGTLGPVVILPEKMLDERDMDLLTAALGHELAHVRRRDYALNLLYELLYMPISFHPAAAWVKRRIRQTREQRCDELVTEKLLNAAAYARSLVTMAGWASRISYSTPTVTVGIVDGDNLEERVMSILRKPRMSTRKRTLSITAASLLFAIPCIAAAPHIFRVSITALQDSKTVSFHEPVPPPYRSAGTVSVHEWVSGQQSEPSRGSQENRENPFVMYGPKAEYSKDAREKRIQGEVKLEATIGTDGVAREIKIISPLYPSLDKSALDAVSTWRFAPAMKDGKPIEKRVPISVGFSLFGGDEDVVPEYQERARQKEARGYAVQALTQDQEREVKELHEKLLEATRIVQEHNLRALEEQIEKLKRDTVRVEVVREQTPEQQSELARQAKISMAKAIEIATKSQPGSVLKCDLRSENEKLFYTVVIISGEKNETRRSIIFVSAMDGKILKTERDQR